MSETLSHGCGSSRHIVAAYSDIIDCLSTLHKRIWGLAAEMGELTTVSGEAQMELIKLLESNSAPRGQPFQSTRDMLLRKKKEADLRRDDALKQVKVSLCAAAPLLTELESLAFTLASAQETAVRPAPRSGYGDEIFVLTPSDANLQDQAIFSSAQWMHPTSFRHPPAKQVSSHTNSAANRRMELLEDSISVVAVESEAATPSYHNGCIETATQTTEDQHLGENWSPSSGGSHCNNMITSSAGEVVACNPSSVGACVSDVVEATGLGVRTNGANQEQERVETFSTALAGRDARTLHSSSGATKTSERESTSDSHAADSDHWLLTPMRQGILFSSSSDRLANTALPGRPQLVSHGVDLIREIPSATQLLEMRRRLSVGDGILRTTPKERMTV